ncbi:hypothetical protein [Pseudomonas sp. EpS/L25]|uniref:hypothetical protein n=1 Tax=Pseudomonas sp. EpS/L25 TaxID=1749078 RepID=UPI000A7E8303|nr:hypothetical protein [Pseudomonas sp. EpS/L25]
MNNRYSTFFLCLLSVCACASGKEASLKCKEADSGNAKDISLYANDIEFTIRNSKRTCDSDFIYEEVILPSKKWMITSWPTSEELGLNAQRDLFIAPSKKSEATYIGSIPVDATPIGTNTYRNIAQSGGSIYETVYQISESSVETKTPSMELVISDSLCAYKKENDSVCQTVTGTFDKPLCIYTDGKKKVLLELSSCSELIQNSN